MPGQTGGGIKCPKWIGGTSYSHFFDSLKKWEYGTRAWLNTTSALSATRRGPDPNRPTRRAYFWKLALSRTPDPIRPTRQGPDGDPNRPTRRVLTLSDPLGGQFFLTGRQDWCVYPRRYGIVLQKVGYSLHLPTIVPHTKSCLCSVLCAVCLILFRYNNCLVRTSTVLFLQQIMRSGLLLNCDWLYSLCYCIPRSYFQHHSNLYHSL